MTLPGTVVDRGRVVPGAPLRDLDTGEDVSAWSFRGRTALLVCFLHEGCEACAAFRGSLARLGEDLRGTGTRLLVAAPGRRFLGQLEPPVLLLVDRDGAAWTSYPAPAHGFPRPEVLASDLWHLARMCPECGAAGWQD